MGTKVAVSLFLVLLCSQVKQELQPFAGKSQMMFTSGVDENIFKGFLMNLW